MMIRSDVQRTEHIRKSKLGKEHKYYREKTIVTFRCDSCGELFTRDKGQMDPKRLSNNYFHVCGNCDAKRFAQHRAVERKKVWDLPASSLKGVGKL